MRPERSCSATQRSSTVKLKLFRSKSSAMSLLVRLLLVAAVVDDIHPHHGKHLVTADESMAMMSPNPNSYVEKNKDGSVTPPLFLVGNGEIDGFNSVAEVTADGFTVSKVLGNYEYMEFDPTFGSMISSKLVVGKDNPKLSPSRTSGKMLTKYQHKSLWAFDTSNSGKLQNATLFQQQQQETNIIMAAEQIINRTNSNHRHNVVHHRRMAAVLGKKKNIIIPFKFYDHIFRPVPPIDDLTILMNNPGPHASLCPTGSVRDVFLASSYNQLDLNTTVAPWIVLLKSEAYYADGRSGFSTRGHEMIRDALDRLQAKGFDFREFDTDNDGYIDAVGFLHSGYGAEWGGTDSSGAHFSSRMWSHKGTLYTLPGGQWTSASGKIVKDYHVSTSLWNTSGSTIGRIGVIAHETAHFFGLPDLYDGINGGQGLGSYCLMGNSWGFDNSQYYPPHLSAWSKIQLGWVTPQVITFPGGSYIARQGCEFPDIFRINTNFGNASEYLLIENRQQCKFDARIPGSGGLAIYHIDDTLTDFTTEGYPGQADWPTNGKHYRVALLQADGKYDLENGTNRGDGTDLFARSPATAFATGISNTGVSNSSGFVTHPHPNTKGYYGGIVRETWININNIGAPGVNMTFTVNFPLPTRSPTRSPTAKPTPKPTHNPTKRPTAKPTFSPTRRPTPKPKLFF